MFEANYRLAMNADAANRHVKSCPQHRRNTKELTYFHDVNRTTTPTLKVGKSKRFSSKTLYILDTIHNDWSTKYMGQCKYMGLLQ